MVTAVNSWVCGLHSIQEITHIIGNTSTILAT